jgi:hypothetical protein
MQNAEWEGAGCVRGGWVPFANDWILEMSGGFCSNFLVPNHACAVLEILFQTGKHTG